MVKNLPANAGDTADAGLIPGSGRSPGEGNSNPPQYSWLENLLDKGAWWATARGVTDSDMPEHTHISNRCLLAYQLGGGLVTELCPTLDSSDCSPPGSSVHGYFPKQEYCSGLPVPPPGDLPGPGIKPASLAAPALQADSLPLSHWRSPMTSYKLLLSWL